MSEIATEALAEVEIPAWVLAEDRTLYAVIAVTKDEFEAARFARASRKARFTLPLDPAKAPRPSRLNP